MMNIIPQVGEAVSAFDFSTIDTSAVLPTVVAGIGFVAAVAIPVMLAKKGWAYAKKAFKF